MRNVCPDAPIRCSPATIAGNLPRQARRVLVFGEPGAGKSTLCLALADHLATAGRPVNLLDADPGSPCLGVPGAITLYRKAPAEEHAWRLRDIDALCTLDAGRFRLPLINAAHRLLTRNPLAENEILLLDAPGVTRGVGASELLSALVAQLQADLIIVLVPAHAPPPLMNELRECGVRTLFVQSDPHARKPEKSVVKTQRSAKWLSYLKHAGTRHFRRDQVEMASPIAIGAAPGELLGRQVALLNGQRTLGMGIIRDVTEREIRVTTPLPAEAEVHRLLVRDAVYNAERGLHTATPNPDRHDQKQQPRIAPLADEALVARLAMEQLSPPIMMRIGPVDATLVNGVFGDPLLLLQIGHQKRCLLFDLGYHGPISARTAHQVSDVFITHAHVDHICGFLWLMRCRIGYYSACRVFGPPGLARHIEGMIDGILWDRIGDKAPCFEVYEIHGQRLRHWQITAGSPLSEEREEQMIEDQVIWQETQFRIRAVTLDHTAKDCGPDNPFTPVLAFAFEPLRQVNVRQERLKALNLSAGPWLEELKNHVLNSDRTAKIRIGKKTLLAGDLADSILLKSAGKRLVYATDLADNAANRTTLCDLARNAHTLFCEASFMNADQELAQLTGHLTTRACGEIGSTAAVEHLIPFHFSGRYQNLAEQIYEEVSAACSNTRRPPR